MEWKGLRFTQSAAPKHNIRIEITIFPKWSRFLLIDRVRSDLSKFKLNMHKLLLHIQLTISTISEKYAIWVTTAILTPLAHNGRARRTSLLVTFWVKISEQKIRHVNNVSKRTHTICHSFMTCVWMISWVFLQLGQMKIAKILIPLLKLHYHIWCFILVRRENGQESITNRFLHTYSNMSH